MITLIKDSLKVIILSTVVLLSVYMVLAQVGWVEPTVAPPGGNVVAPLNTGSTGQSKSGGLILNTSGALNGLIVQSGNVGIGTTSPYETLSVSGNLSLGNNRLVDIATPIASTDGATKGYVDAQTSGPYWAFRSCNTGSYGTCTVTCPVGTTIQAWATYRDDTGSPATTGNLTNNAKAGLCSPNITLGVSTSFTCTGSYYLIAMGIICSK